MSFRQLELKGCYEYIPTIFEDPRGFFFEAFKASLLKEAIGSDFRLAQVNSSKSTKGTIRGIHFAQLPPGQQKYVMCTVGSIWDVVVDLRQDSPTFGKWESITLDSQKRNALFIPNGFGHGFQALTNDVEIIYLCDSEYDPSNEKALNPLDASIGIEWPLEQQIISDKDLAAPSFINFFQT